MDSKILYLKNSVEQLWNEKESVGTSSSEETKKVIQETLGLLDNGILRVSEKINGIWKVNEWLKKAVLISFKIKPVDIIAGGPGNSSWWDKIPSKFSNWTKKDFNKNNFRSVPGSIVRYSAYIAPDVVLMPSFVNLGARVESGTMVDTWTTIGSCAQIGKNCHISGGAGIGGVLEPMQANPTIIEDNCFIGARSEVVEGVIVGEGSVLSMGVFIGQSTKIVARETGKVIFGKIPPYSVIVPGSLPSKDGKEPSLYCAVIIKQVDEKTRSKTSINDLLRD